MTDNGPPFARKRMLPQKKSTFKMDPFFILGSGRSGTTLLSAMLNATGQVYIPPESDFITRAYPFFFDKTEFLNDDYRKIAGFFVIASQDSWKMDKGFLFSLLMKYKPKTFSEINDLIYSTFLENSGFHDRGWGIKQPILIAHLNRVINVFPNGKIIHLIRDGRDVCLSYADAHKMNMKFGPKGILTTALYWVDGLRRIDRSREQINIIEIRYEDLLSDFTESMKIICNFLNIHFDRKRVEQYHKCNDNLIFIGQEHCHTIHKKVNKGLDKNNFGKYKKLMARYQIFLFELFAGPYLIKYHYRLNFQFLKSRVWDVIRLPAYCFAKHFNNIRYSRRDKSMYRRASEIPTGTVSERY